MLWASVACAAIALGAAEPPVLLDFYADWCGPCRKMAPALEQLEGQGYSIRRVNIDHEPELAQRFGVEGVPTFVVVADGQEQSRAVGMQDIAKLQTMLDAAAPAPAPARAPARSVAATRSAPTRPASAAAPALLPAQPAAQPLPAQRAEAKAPVADGVLAPRLLAATVRLQIEDARGNSHGTGTIVDQRQGEALVLTCGHVFRDSQGKGKITVDLFGPGMPRGLPGHLIAYDLERDLGLVAIRPGRSVIAARVAPPHTLIEPDMPVVSVGCDHGGEPTARRTRVTSIDRYQGPPNLQVAGQPVQGRSGGGLFNAEGQVIGVCNAADPQDGEGLFAALASIQSLLDRSQLAMLYREDGDLAPVDTLADADAKLPPLELPAMPAGFAEAAATPGQVVRASAVATLESRGELQPAERAVLEALRQHGNSAEVICIVRSKGDPQSPGDVVVLDRASPELLQILTADQAAQAGHSSPQRGGMAAAAAAVGSKLRPASWLPNLNKINPLGRGGVQQPVAQVPAVSP